MKNPKIMLIRTLILVVCLFLILFAGSTNAKPENVEVQTSYTLPQYGYKTEVTRVIESYEKLIGRFIDLQKQNANNLSQNVQNLNTTMTNIQSQLTDISNRLSRIEKSLDIRHQQPPTHVTPKN